MEKEDFSSYITVQDGNKVLKEGVDYKVVRPSVFYGKKDIGKAVMYVEGIGNYEGVYNINLYVRLSATQKVMQSGKRLDTTLKIKWSKVSGATSYEIYRSTSKNGKYKLVGTTKSRTYTDTTVKSGRTYYYKIKAKATDGNDKIYSDYSKSFKISTICAKPANLKIKKTTSGKKITWKKSYGADGYYVYISTSKNGKYRKVANVRNGKTTYVHKTSKKYYYKVCAYSNSDRGIMTSPKK